MRPIPSEEIKEFEINYLEKKLFCIKYFNISKK